MKSYRLIALLLIASMTALSTPSPAQADTPAKDRAVARERLVGYGVDPAQVEGRVAALTDDEVRELAARIDELPAGGNIIGLFILIMLLSLFR